MHDFTILINIASFNRVDVLHDIVVVLDEFLDVLASVSCSCCVVKLYPHPIYMSLLAGYMVQAVCILPVSSSRIC